MILRASRRKLAQHLGAGRPQTLRTQVELSHQSVDLACKLDCTRSEKVQPYLALLARRRLRDVEAQHGAVNRSQWLATAHEDRAGDTLDEASNTCQPRGVARVQDVCLDDQGATAEHGFTLPDAPQCLQISPAERGEIGRQRMQSQSNSATRRESHCSRGGDVRTAQLD